MNRFHSILFMVILAFASSALAAGKNSSAGARVDNGYFDIAKVDGEGKYAIGGCDSTSGICLHVEHGWDGPCCASEEYLRLFIGKKKSSNQYDSIWMLTDYIGIDSLHSELKKGNPLTLEKFTKLEFDSTHEQYFVDGKNERGDIEINSGLPPVDSPGFHDYLESLSDINGYRYILYKRENSVSVLCSFSDFSCAYEIGCFYQNDGSFVFDSLPNAVEMVGGGGVCLVEEGASLPSINRGAKKNKDSNELLYKVNGIPASKGSSNIVIRKNKQPKLRLKGKR